MRKTHFSQIFLMVILLGSLHGLFHQKMGLPQSQSDSCQVCLVWQQLSLVNPLPSMEEPSFVIFSDWERFGSESASSFFHCETPDSRGSPYISFS